MSKIPNLIKYDRTIFMYAASRALEQSAYYGMRSILILYMLNGILSVSENDTMQFYSWFIQGTIAAGVIGAVFGDFDHFDEIEKEKITERKLGFGITQRVWFWDMFSFNKRFEEKAGKVFVNI